MTIIASTRRAPEKKKERRRSCSFSMNDGR
jgi:hypothetical protein